ncbi:MAG: uracil phosphoribosyltransferase [Holosporales bacterium]|nr:uracil phosphoribosyltransferase [Holosporales bacterium]
MSNFFKKEIQFIVMLLAINSGDSFAGLVVLNHSLISHHLSIIRDKKTKSYDFKKSLKKISKALIYEAAKDLPVVSINVKTPVGNAKCKCIDLKSNIIVVSILRAGLGISSVAESIIPNTETYHLGMKRDEKTHEVSLYYNNFPKAFKNKKVFVCDPMLATGGSIYEAIKLLTQRGIKAENIVCVCIVSAPEGVKRISEAFPGVKIITAVLDEKLNENAYIVPGLGDAGDRYFNALNF